VTAVPRFTNHGSHGTAKTYTLQYVNEGRVVPAWENEPGWCER
jgi:hypothetical protein